MVKDVKPLNEFILLDISASAIKKEKTTESGVILIEDNPTEAEQGPPTGIVLRVSDEVTTVTEGSTVLYKKFSGIPYHAEDGTYCLLIDVCDLLGVVEGGE